MKEKKEKKISSSKNDILQNIKRILRHKLSGLHIVYSNLRVINPVILLPDLFLVSKFGIVSIIFILVLGFVDTYVIDFFRYLTTKYNIIINITYIPVTHIILR